MLSLILKIYCLDVVSLNFNALLSSSFRVFIWSISCFLCASSFWIISRVFFAFFLLSFFFRRNWVYNVCWTFFHHILWRWRCISFNEIRLFCDLLLFWIQSIFWIQSSCLLLFWIQSSCLFASCLSFSNRFFDILNDYSNLSSLFLLFLLNELSRFLILLIRCFYIFSICYFLRIKTWSELSCCLRISWEAIRFFELLLMLWNSCCSFEKILLNNVCWWVRIENCVKQWNEINHLLLN
jgi:hypothetical protein